MDIGDRIERTLRSALASVSQGGAPPTLVEALEHALFPGGARIRPQLCLTVALACGDRRPELSNAAAAAVELFHCASLVHDDLPCFDDAPLRRGRPTVHRIFGEPLAVLVGDQLIVLGFEVLARAAETAPQRLPALMRVMASGVGMPRGIIAGQAWESEECIPMATYRRAKTGALFEAAAMAGAIAAGRDGESFRRLGQRVGEAYQVADDIQDMVGSAEQMGKPSGRDMALGRPNVAQKLGVQGSERLFDKLMGEALESLPLCEKPEGIALWLRAVGERLARLCRPAQGLSREVESGAA